ncbi:MAG: tetratricopeptide repeat protein [Verrucomicrobiota bacterium]|jgi:tetratricopeptide (TPR) repeat protein|nr:MAG: tetratricopeptide repeat protein [Verrucomicrobiota bacterium]
MKKDPWILLKSIMLISIGLFVYSPIWSASWVWDDTIEILNNLEIRGSISSLSSIWVNPRGLDYLPVKSTLQWFEWHLWGANPLGYHLVSLGLHLCSSLLVWRILKKLGLSLAWWGGVLFLVHPIAVQSVAWISELKNTLSLPLMLLAFDTFIEYDTALNEKSSRSHLLYFYSLGLFLLAMLAKASVVMLPFSLVLYVWWKRSHVTKKELFTLSSYFIVSLALGLVTIYFQHTRAIGGESIAIGTTSERLLSSILSFGFYLKSFLIPSNLTPIYPRWPLGTFSFINIIGWTLLISFLLFLVKIKSKKSKNILFGFGWFSINLIPILGVIPMSFLKYAQVSDHFAYISILGLIGLTVLATGSLIDWLQSKSLYLSYCASVGSFCLLSLLAYISYYHAKDFESDTTFYTKIIHDNPSCWMAHDNLGNIYNDTKRYPEAISEYTEVLKLVPRYAKAHYNLGLALVDSGHIPEGIYQYEEALSIHPEYAEVHNNLGIALSLSGRCTEAIVHFQEAIQLRPNFSEAELNWGLALAKDNRIPEALEHFQGAVRLNPASDHAHLILGYALQALGRQTEADEELALAQKLKTPPSL